MTDTDLITTPIGFASEVLGVHLYPWQDKVITWYENAPGRRVKGSLCTPNGAGKDSMVIATLALWWVCVHPRGRVVITSKDSRQIDEQTCPALERHKAKFSDWKWIEHQIETPTGGKIILFTTTEGGRAEGWHRDTLGDGTPDTRGPLLLIANEAKSIDSDIFAAFDRCTYDGLLYASSPGAMHGRFYESQSKPDLGFRTARVGLLECPHIPQERIDDIVATYGANSPFTRSTLHGEFLEAFDGKPVFYAYNQDIHEGSDLPWVKGAYLVRGWDFGTCNAVTWSMYFQHRGYEYLHVLQEQYLEGSDTDRQAEAALKLTEQEFPFWNDRNVCSGLTDFSDPAGANANFGATYRRNAEGKAERIGSCVQILNTHGIRPGTLLWQRGIAVGVALINRFLNKRDDQGNPCFRIDRKHCPLLAKAFRGGYAYGEPGESGYNPDSPEPRKGLAHQPMDYSHVCFVAGTIISTARGEVPIETIGMDDLALTRRGYCRVVGAGQRIANVRHHHFSDETKLICTDDHPVWSCARNKFVPVAELTRQDSVYKLGSLSGSVCMLSMGDASQKKVFNITVENAHEYFANGILVSNCDALRYPALNTLRLLKSEHEKTNPSLYKAREISNLNPERFI